MKKVIFYLLLFSISFCVLGQNDTININLNEVSVVSFYRPSLGNNNIISKEYIDNINKGQEPSFILSKLPSIISYSDTGNEYGYSYFRIRGIDQTRINMTLDGMPLNEGEDMGVYFSNYPDLFSSLHSVEVNKGATISNNGVSGYGGSINFESVNLKKDTLNSCYLGYGSFNTYKGTLQLNTNSSDKYALNIKTTYQHSDGYREHAFNTSYSIFVKGGYFINPNHDINILSFVGHSENGQGYLGATLDEIKLNPRVNGCSIHETDNFTQNISKIQYKGIINNNILTASIYYNFLKGDYYFDNDNFMKRMIDTNWQNTNEIYNYDLKHNMFGGNFVVKSYINDIFKITNGINYSRFNRRHIGTWNKTTDILYNNKGFKDDLNIFTNSEITLKQFISNINLQYRFAKFAYHGDKEFKPITWNFFNWSYNAKYNFTKHFNIYSKITQTHREPTRSDMFGGEENYSTLATKQHEEVIDGEFGFNYNTRSLKINVNGFFMRFKNELILNGLIGTNGLPLRENVNKSFRRGIEISLEYHPTSFLTYINNTSYSNNKIEIDNKKLNHILSPKYIISQDIIYKYENFELGVNVYNRSNMFIDLDNQYQINKAFKINTYANFYYKNFTLSCRINNITNEQNFSNGVIGAKEPLYFIDEPRNLMFNLIYKI